jgi:nicotinic acid mononucleotide adenylyltransferase
MIDAPCTLTSSPGIFLIDAVTTRVSSTAVRRALAAGESMKGLLPDAVAEYAVRQRLYVGSSASING